MKEQIAQTNSKFQGLNQKQRLAVRKQAEKANKQEEENLLTTYFENWAGEAKLDRVIKHYAGKMDAKKHQLDAVQTMFQSFAVQLEQGISQSPRSHRKSAKKMDAKKHQLDAVQTMFQSFAV